MSKMVMALLVALLGAAPFEALAVVISVAPDAGLAANPAALAAFNRAGEAWSSRFSNPITINIAAGLTGGFAPNHIGHASSVKAQANYNFFRDKIVAAAANEPDDVIVAALPTLAQFTASMPPGIVFNNKFSATKANFKALGYMDLIDLDAQLGWADATLTFNNAYAFDYDNSDGVSPGTIDFQTVVEHEIGHALGFISAVDGVDFMKDGGLVGQTLITPLDLFRFRNGVAGQDPTTLAEFTSFPRYLDTGGAAIFDDLLTETGLGTGQLTGDGDEASHWKNDDLTGQLLGVMDGSIYGGEIHPITAADIRALDLIGYQHVPVPEPGSPLLLVSGAGAAGLGLRWRRRHCGPRGYREG